MEKVHISWNGQYPVTYEFATNAEANAFLLGISTAIETVQFGEYEQIHDEELAEWLETFETM